MSMRLAVSSKATGHVSPFSTAVAADAWDAWFRWRDLRGLHDLSIDATFSRVAHALAAAEIESKAGAFEKRLTDAFASWQLLLDERLLASAGTDRPAWSPRNLVAVLNAAMFVRGRFTGNAHFDYVAFADTAGLAVRALDDATVLASGKDRGDALRFEVGLVGLGETLAFLRLAYDSESARAEATMIARTLAEACHRESERLARERGACPGANEPVASALHLRTPAERLRELSHYGVRHAALTAITSQPRLALFANDVTDALDPLRNARSSASTGFARKARESEYAISAAREIHTPHAVPAALRESASEVTIRAQIEMRGAMQPWIDRPIAYPFVVARIPDIDEQRELRTLAAFHRLGEAEWASLNDASPRRLPSLTE